MTNKTTFVSNNSFSEAQQRAKLSGYIPVGQARNPKTGQFIVFAKKFRV